MRIDAFHIDGFGHFANQSFLNIPPGLSVILGDNEAGKSTLLAFVRSILFGFPSRKQKEFYPPLNGGRKRGRLVLLYRESNQIMVERCEGKGVGPVTATFSDGTPVSEEDLRRLLGSATASLYENVFAFSLGELQAFETLKTESIREAIYSAGIGVGRRTITQVLSELKRQSGELFAAGGSKPLMNKLLGRIEELARQIREHEGEIQEYQRLHAELHDTEAALGEAKSELHKARRRCARIELLQQARNDWIAQADARLRLEALPPAACFPEDGLRRFDELVVERRGLRSQLGATAKECETLQEQLASIVASEVLIEKAEEINRLDRGRELHSQRQSRHASLIKEREVAEAKLGSILKDLGEEWTQEKLQAFSLSVAQQEELDSCRRLLHSVSDLIRNLEPENQHAKRELRDAVEYENEARTRFEELPAPSPTLDADRITKLVLARQNYSSAHHELPGLEKQCSAKVENLQDTLQRIGPNWTEARLREFDTSLAIHERISFFRRTMSTCNSEHVEAVKSQKSASEALLEAEGELARSEEVLRLIPPLPISDEAAIVERKKRLRALQQQLREVVQQRTRLDDLMRRKQELNDHYERLQHQMGWPNEALPTWIPVAVVGIGVVGLLLFGIVRNDWFAGGAVFGVAGTIAGILLVSRWNVAKRSESMTAKRTDELSQFQSRVTSLDSEISEVQQQVDASVLLICKQFKPPRQELPSLQHLEELELAADRDLDVLRQRQPAEQRRNNAVAAREKRDEELSLAQSAVNQNAEALDDVAKQWQQWLRNVGFPETLSPEDAASLLSRLDIAREQLKAINADRTRIEQLSSCIEDYEAEVKDVADKSDVIVEPTSNILSIVDVLTSNLDERKNAQTAWEHAKRRLDEAVLATGRMQKNSDAIAESLKKEQDKESNLQADWQALLQQLGLRRSLLPESVPQLVQTIARAHDQLDLVTNKHLEVEGVQQQLDANLQAVRALAKELERPEPGDEDVTNCVGSLAAELRRDEQLRDSAEALRQDLKKSEKKSTELNEQLGLLQTEIDSLLSLADASDEEAFRTKASAYFTRCELEKELEQLETRLVRIAGSPELVQTLKEELTNSTPDALATDILELEQLIATRETGVTDGASQVGRLTERLGQLESAEELSRLRTEHQAALSELQSAAEEWSILRITATLIEKARDRYERERRPAVLKEAERYFFKFTSGKYTQLRPSLDGDQVTVMSASSETKNVDQLSRGTAEQLYLSLRFGFIQEFSRRSEPLPLIFDDILVNFDPDRAKAAAEAILDLSKSQQILFFTCHPATVQLIRDVDVSVPVYHLQDGSLTRDGTQMQS